MKHILVAVCLAALAAPALAQQGSAQSPGNSTVLTANQPDGLGFAPERLERLHAAMQSVVDQKALPGVVTLLVRHGQVEEERVYGKKDIAAGTPMTPDAIFRIFSMTKPVTGVAMMILYEEGKWKPSDPISKFIPEFAHLKVYKGTDASGNIILEDPVHPPTMRELMTHTAGFTYGFFGDAPVDKLYQESKPLESKSLQEMIDRLAKLPLLYQPGSKWVYSLSMDIQGYIIEKLSGQSLPGFMQQHIFGPLRMTDTGFFVPQEKSGRFASLYGGDKDGTMIPMADAGSYSNFHALPGLPSGGGGLVSTAQDYRRFAQMLLNKGELDGIRILSPASVALMTTNHLPDGLFVLPGVGYGYDCSVIPDPLQADTPVGKGTFWWGGAADTWFWIDPANDLVFIGMTQRMIGPGQPDMPNLSQPIVYGAMIDPNR
jgi:CubicO group peptidase (beta-lactamase class C family)